MSMHYISGDFRYYIVGIVPEEEGNFSAYVIDFPEVAAGGDTIEEAIESAFYGISVTIRDRIDRGIEIPKPSSMDHVVAMTKAARAEAELPYPENAHYQYVKSPSIDMTPVKMTVTVKKWMVDAIDSIAEKEHITRGEIIASLMEDYIDENE